MDKPNFISIHYSGSGWEIDEYETIEEALKTLTDDIASNPKLYAVEEIPIVKKFVIDIEKES